MLNQKLIQQEYAFLSDHIFLNVSSVVMPPVRVQKAYETFMAEYIANFGDDIVPKAWQMVEETREKAARLLHAKSPKDIAFVKNTCEGISILASGFPFQKGDNIIVPDQEHQSSLFPWINLHERKGVDLRVVPSRNGEVRTEDLIAAMDENTKVLALSAVQFSTGFYADLKTLGYACRERGIIFCVDGIQALGRLDINVQEMCIDYLAAGTNKGLLGTLGAGFICCGEELARKIIPPYAGYQSVVSHVAPPAITTNFETLEWHPNARRFESGNLSYNCIQAISKGMELLLELGITEIEAHIRRLETKLRENLSDLSLHVVQAKDPANWGGVVCVYYPADAEEQVIGILKQYKIHCTMRGGYIRLGLDFYNTMEQMELVSKALHEIDKL